MLTEVYQRYQQRLLELNCVDFGDILLYALNILLSNADVLETYQNRFKYIMVDEYQDTNVTQYLFLRLLSQKSRNLCCVGDDDQSIYSWRGAEIENILRFEKDFPTAKPSVSNATTARPPTFWQQPPHSSATTKDGSAKP